MINLIPQEEQIFFRLKTRKKITFIFCFLAMFFFACLISLLFAIKYYVNAGLESQKDFVKNYQENEKISEISEIQRKVASFNKTVEGIGSFYDKKVVFSQVIEKISTILPKSAYLNNISIDYTGEDKILKVSLEGFIQNREDLFYFKKSLEKETDIREVSFPPSDWLKSENIDFQASFKIKQ